MPPSIRSMLLGAARGALRADDARMDTTAAASAAAAGMSGAAVSNLISGLGGSRDSGAMARPNTSRDHLSTEELEALLRGTVYRRIVSLPAVWGTTKGWAVTDDTDDEKPLQDEMRRLKVRQAVREADQWARAFGEARIWPIVDDGKQDLRQPLDPARVKKIHRLEVLDFRDLTPVEYETDARRGRMGEPSLFLVSPRRRAALSSQYVHASRLLRFYGDELPPSTIRTDWGADAIGQTLWDGLRNTSQVSSGGAKLAQELSVAVFKLAKLPGGTAGDDRTGFLAALGLMNLMKSVAQSVIIGPADDFQRVAANPSGFKDLSEDARLHLAMLTGIPMALLFGEAPAGLNTDGASWQASWHAAVAAHQDERYRPPLERLVEMMYYADRGKCPDEWSLEFKPLGELSEREKADIRLVHVQADTIEQMDGVLTAEERRTGRYGQPGGFATELQPVVEDEPEEGKPGDLRLVQPPESDPGEVEAVAAMVERAKRAAAAAAAPTEDRHDATEGAVWIGAVVPASTHAAIAEARAAVEAVTGPLAVPTEDPHVTVLWMGQVPPEYLGEVIEIARSVVERRNPDEAEVEHAVTFPPSESSEGKWPVVLDVGRAWGLYDLHHNLLRRLAHLVTARQFPEYRSHLTLGYAESLTPEQVAAVAEVEIPEAEWMIGGLQVRYGSQVVATLPLSGRMDAAAAK